MFIPIWLLAILSIGAVIGWIGFIVAARYLWETWKALATAFWR